MHTLIFTDRQLEVLTAPTKVQYTVVSFQTAKESNHASLYNILGRTWNEIVLDVGKETIEEAHRILKCRPSCSTSPVTYLRQVGMSDHKNVVLVAGRGIVFTVLDDKIDVYKALFKELLSKTHPMVSDLMHQIISTMMILVHGIKEEGMTLRNFYGYFSGQGLKVRCKNELKEEIYVPGLLKVSRIPAGETQVIEDFYDPAYSFSGGKEPVTLGMRDDVYVAYDPAIKFDNAPTKTTTTEPPKISPVEPPKTTATEPPKMAESATARLPKMGWWKVVNRTALEVTVFNENRGYVLRALSDIVFYGPRPTTTSHNPGRGTIMLPIVDGQNEVVTVGLRE